MLRRRIFQLRYERIFFHRVKKDGDGRVVMRIPHRYEEFQTLGDWHHLTYAVPQQHATNLPTGARNGVVCTLRTGGRHKSLARVNKVRTRVIKWLKRADKEMAAVSFRIGPVLAQTSNAYFEAMRGAEIVVTGALINSRAP